MSNLKRIPISSIKVNALKRMLRHMNQGKNRHREPWRKLITREIVLRGNYVPSEI